MPELAAMPDSHPVTAAIRAEILDSAALLADAAMDKEDDARAAAVAGVLAHALDGPSDDCVPEVLIPAVTEAAWAEVSRVLDGDQDRAQAAARLIVIAHVLDALTASGILLPAPPAPPSA